VAKGRRRAKKALAVLVVLAAVVWAVNTSRFTDPEGEPLLLAHRGLGQTFDLEGVENDTCTAERIHPPEHPYLENTLPSMQAAFDAGADIVELDIHQTIDNRLVVFHDWTLDCRTEGTGEVRDATLEELQKLDVGYGYTADGGRTFPFRGKGVGMIPTLDQVLETFPDHQLLLHLKGDDPSDGKLLAARLEQFPPQRLEQLAVYGGNRSVAAAVAELPGLRAMSRATLKSCLGWYIALGWTSYVPSTCDGAQVHIPDKIGPWLWGWPHKFVDRMESHGVRVVVVKGSLGFSDGFDSPEDVRDLPEGFAGVIWTNRIDEVAPVLAD
jgi:glycerophosphoryl diester phosphodiesterase